MAELFGRDRSVIGKHVRACFNEVELVKSSVWAKFAYTATDGKDYNVDFYNLDVIISVGYRVHSKQGTQFRIWATNILRGYLLKGYSVNKHLIALQQEIETRMTRIEDRQERQQEQLDFFIKTSTPPAEMVFFNGQFFTARVAVELKDCRFQPAHLGQLSFYLTLLDKQTRKPHENPPIGLVLCHEMDGTVVELAIRDYTKPMGVATFRLGEDAPDKYNNLLPDTTGLNELMQEED